MELETYRRQRPGRVTALALATLLVAVLGLVRAIQTGLQWSFLTQMLPISPAYLLGTGILGALVGLPLAWGLWRGERWAYRGVAAFFAAVILFYWVERLLLTAPDSRPSNDLFVISISLLLLGLILSIVSARSTRVFFGEWHDPKSEDSTTA